MNTKIVTNVWTDIINWLVEEEVVDVDVAVVDVIVAVFVGDDDAVDVETVVLEMLTSSILSRTCSHNNILSSI